ncbi:MAG: hypothetical protein LBU64_10340 [Planctomycetota bacterium]|jgi:hypothetical protein|nr:hypothetical protein [Planctomycetota bacterium]
MPRKKNGRRPKPRLRRSNTAKSDSANRVPAGKSSTPKTVLIWIALLLLLAAILAVLENLKHLP